MPLRKLLPLVLLLLVAGSVHAGTLPPGVWYYNNITVNSGYVIADSVNTTAPVHLAVLTKNDYQTCAHEWDVCRWAYNKTVGKGIYVIRVAPGNYTFITYNPQLRNITVNYFLTTLPLPSYIFNRSSLTYIQAATTVLKLFDVTPSQKTSIDSEISTNATLAASFKNYTESYSNGDLSFTEWSAGTETYVISNLDIVNSTATVTSSSKCNISQQVGGEINHCIEDSQSQTENLSQIFSGSTTGAGGVFNSSEMAQLRNNTYSAPGEVFIVHPNQSITVPAGTFKVYYINATSTQQVQTGGTQTVGGQVWVDSSSGTVDKAIISVSSLATQSVPLGGWKGTFSSNTTVVVTLEGSNITQTAPSTTSTTISGYNTTIYTTSISSANQPSAGATALGFVIGIVLLVCLLYAIYRFFNWVRRRFRGGAQPKQSQEPKKAQKTGKKQ